MDDIFNQINNVEKQYQELQHSIIKVEQEIISHNEGTKQNAATIAQQTQHLISIQQEHYEATCLFQTLPSPSEWSVNEARYNDFVKQHTSQQVEKLCSTVLQANEESIMEIHNLAEYIKLFQQSTDIKLEKQLLQKDYDDVTELYTNQERILSQLDNTIQQNQKTLRSQATLISQYSHIFNSILEKEATLQNQLKDYQQQLLQLQQTSDNSPLIRELEQDIETVLKENHQKRGLYTQMAANIVKIKTHALDKANKK